jgi:peptidoglycan/LPS O-acetylase OafA/YrhL
MGGWTAAAWANVDVSTASVMRHVLLLGIHESDRGLDPVLWSLVLELRFSLLLIPLALLGLRSFWALVVLSIASYVLGAILASQLGMSEPFQVGLSAAGSVAILLIYLPTFVLGVVAGVLFARTEARPHPWAPFMLCLAAPVVAKLGHNEFITGLAFTGVVIAAASPGPIAKLLASRPIAFLGTISYSLYLIHFPIMMTLAYAFGRSAGYGAPMLLAPALALIAATALHYAVEKPGIALGKRMLEKLPLPRTQAA